MFTTYQVSVNINRDHLSDLFVIDTELLPLKFPEAGTLFDQKFNTLIQLNHP